MHISHVSSSSFLWKPTSWKKRIWVLAFGFLSGCGGGKTAATITGVRIQPRVGANNNDQLIYVDWKNTGTTPIYRVSAAITVFDASGKVISQINKTEIYDSVTPVAGGATCSPFEVKPYYFVPQNSQSKAARATAKLLRIGKAPTVYLP